MYQIVENPKMMIKEEIDKEFDGKWVYVVKANVTRHGELLEGMPVIVADSPYEGTEDGIYKMYRKSEYEERLDYNLKHYEPFISSNFAVEFVQ